MIVPCSSVVVVAKFQDTFKFPSQNERKNASRSPDGSSVAVPFFFVSKGEVSIEKPRENSPWEGEDRFLFGIT